MRADLVVKSIIFNRDYSRILLLQRSSDDSIGANTWEGVGGNIEQGETPEAAIKREIREEAGIQEIVIKSIAYATVVDGREPYLIIAYVCESPTESVTLSEEHQAFMWADKETCKALLPKAILNDFENNDIFQLFSASTD